MLLDVYLSVSGYVLLLGKHIIFILYKIVEVNKVVIGFITKEKIFETYPLYFCVPIYYS